METTLRVSEQSGAVKFPNHKKLNEFFEDITFTAMVYRELELSTTPFPEVCEKYYKMESTNEERDAFQEYISAKLLDIQNKWTASVVECIHGWVFKIACTSTLRI